MKEYKAKWDYRVPYGERDLEFVKGQTYWLEDEVAAWVERDCPGTLEEVKQEPKRRAKSAPSADRQSKGGNKR